MCGPGRMHGGLRGMRGASCHGPRAWRFENRRRLFCLLKSASLPGQMSFHFAHHSSELVLRTRL